MHCPHDKKNDEKLDEKFKNLAPKRKLTINKSSRMKIYNSIQILRVNQEICGRENKPLRILLHFLNIHLFSQVVNITNK